MRPEGVRGLCAAVFGEGDASSDHAELEKLDHVARVLSTVPSGMQSKVRIGPASCVSGLDSVIGILRNHYPSCHQTAVGRLVCL